jgi:hypothetical protein
MTSYYQPFIDAAADENGIPRGIFTSLVDAESSFNPSAISPTGAVGLTQLMPSTAAELGVDPFDPLDNLSGGASYLAQQYKRFGNWTDALSAYNAGPGNIGAGKQYAQKVLANSGYDGDIGFTGPIKQTDVGVNPDTGEPVYFGTSDSLEGQNKSSGGYASFLPSLPNFLQEYGLPALLILLAIFFIASGTAKMVLSSDTGKFAIRAATKAL